MTKPLPVYRKRGAPILVRLRALRTRARAILVVDGTSTLAVVAVALSLATFGLDRAFRLPRSTRAGLLAACVAVLGVVVSRKLVARLAAPLPLDELARAVESQIPALDFRLVSAVQFLEGGGGGPEASAELRSLVVDEAEDVATGVPFGVALDLGGAAAHAARGAVVLVAGLALAVGFPDAAGTWFARSVLLSATAEWPKATRLRVKGFEDATTLAIPRGSDFVLEVLAQGEVPLRTYVDLRLPGSGLEATQPLPALDGGLFRTVFERASEDMELRVRGGDDAVGPLLVKVLRRPSLQWLQVTPWPPAYTHVQVAPFRSEAGEVELPEGTAVRLESLLATQTPPKRLARAWAELALVGAKPGTPPLRLDAAIDAAAEGLAVDFALERTTAIQVDVVDHDGLGLDPPARITLRARADAAPKVSLALKGVGQMVTPEVTLPLELKASDDYGLQGGFVRLKATGGGLPQAREDQFPIADLEGGRTEASLALTWDLGPLGFKPGTVVAVQAQAKDGDPKGAKTTLSGSFALHVVDQEQLENEMLRRQHEARRELERVRDEEEKLAQGLTGQDEKTLERAGRTQRGIHRTTGDVARAIAQVVEEMKWNKLGDERARGRLTDGVVVPLEQLKEGLVAQARDAIDAAAQAPPADRGERSKEAGSACEAALAELNVILERMKRLEDIAALSARLRTILKQEREVMEETRKARGGK